MHLSVPAARASRRGRPRPRRARSTTRARLRTSPTPVAARDVISVNGHGCRQPWRRFRKKVRFIGKQKFGSAHTYKLHAQQSSHAHTYPKLSDHVHHFQLVAGAFDPTRITCNFYRTNVSRILKHSH